MEPLIWHTEQRKPIDLLPYKNNPRKMSETMRINLEESLKKFNLAEIPVINLDNTLIAGHQRVKALITLNRGEEPIDVRVPNRQLTIDELEEYNIASNKVTGDWDNEKLRLFKKETLEKAGFSQTELEKIFKQETEKPQVPFTEELMEAHNYIVLYFDNEIDWLNLQTLFPLQTVQALDSRPGFEKKGVGRVIRGTEFIKKIKGE